MTQSGWLASAAPPPMSDRRSLWTVGHSNLEIEEFLGNLRLHEIEAIADVRSWPKSRHVPWFDKDALAVSVKAAGLSYVWLGRELGGRPDEDEMYAPDGKVRYDKVAATPLFQEGLRRLGMGMERMRVAILCSEENPEHCHRRLLVARVLHDAGMSVLHIRRTGDVEPEAGFVIRTNLFGDEEQLWISTASVLQKRRPRTSSSV